MDLLVVPLLAALVYFGVQGAAPTERVTLLPDASGQVGALLVKTSEGEQLLNSAYADARVFGRGRIEVHQNEASLVRARYASTLSALPLTPISFMVYFVSGSDTELTVESALKLAQMKAVLASRPAPEITVIGHTDRVGSEADNDALSIRRAANVRDILASVGVPAATIELAGRGERELLVPTADDVDQAMNRRVEINLR